MPALARALLRIGGERTFTMLRKIMLVVGLAAASGCYAYGYDGYYSTSDLAYVSPGVSVVTGSDYPIFYADNSYWLYDRGLWYSSPYYYGGWSYAVPPASVLGIYHPGSYVHYYPHGTYYGARYYGHGYYGAYPRYYGHPYYGGPYWAGRGTYHGGYRGTYHGGGGRHR